MSKSKYVPTAKDRAFAERLAKEQKKVQTWRTTYLATLADNQKYEKEIEELKAEIAHLNSLLEEMTGCTHDEILEYIAEKRRTNDNIAFVRNIFNMGGMYYV